jgi:acetyl-CoA carboxylase biotin carboxyl carrier protein
MELKLIQRLVALMHRGELTELEIEDPASGLRVRLKRGAEAPPPAAGPVVHVTHGAAAALSAAPAGAPPAGEAPGAAHAPAAVAGVPFVSPMVGTFYRAASPDAEPFVQVGQRVTPETVLCVIEAMKVMNEIKAELSGEILGVLVENGEPVEFGQPLFQVKPA